MQPAAQAWVDAGFAGMQLRVHDERGEWAGSAGVRKLGQTAKPPTNGRFWAGSIAKTFTATVVLQLVAEGKVGLDTSVHSYLPEFELDRRITVRMLLQHTSGLANYTGQYYPDGAFVPGIPVAGQTWWTTGSTPTGRRNWYGWRCPCRSRSSRERARTTPTPTSRWPCC